jgi:O-antigen ligase
MARRAAKHGRPTPHLDPQPAAPARAERARAAVRWILLALGLLYFPSAFFGSFWLIPLIGTLVGLVWFYLEGWTTCWKELVVLLLILLVYSASSALSCWREGGICIDWMYAQEAYVLAAGLFLYVCGFIAPGRTGRSATVIYGLALGSFVVIAMIVLLTRENLSVEIRPQFQPLLIERNDLAPLVAWMFFVYGLFRSTTESALWRSLAYLSALVVAGLLTMATQSRLVALISVLGAIAWAPIDRRSKWHWAMVGVALACLVAVEYQRLEQLIHRVLLTAGGPSVATRFFLWSAGWKMFVAAPWLGHGLGGFSELVVTYAIPLGEGLDTRLISWPHNVPIEILVEKGIAGFVAFLCLPILAIRNLMSRPPDYSNGIRRAAGYLLLAFILVGLLDSSIKRLWYLPSLLYVLGMSAGLLRRRNSAIDSMTAPHDVSMDKTDTAQ